MTILAIECSSAVGSVAAMRDGERVFSESFTAPRGRSAALFPVLERALKITGLCDRVIVGLGPGSYSGVRVAISAAIGIELAGSTKVAGIPSIVAMNTEALSYLVVGDARRQTYFRARVDDGLITEGPDLLPLSDLLPDGSLPESLPILSVSPVPGLDRALVTFPSAERLLALERRGRGIAATGDLEPIYLREPLITVPKSKLSQQTSDV